MAQWTEREKQNAVNVFQAVERAVSDSLERGEMQKFTEILAQQQNVKGLLEFSLFNRQGSVSHSSNASFLKRPVSDNVKNKLTAGSKMLIMEQQDVIDIYRPLVATGDCIRCHIDWQEGQMSGALYLKFSAKELKAAEKQAKEVVSSVKRNTLYKTLFTLLIMIGFVALTVHQMVRKIIITPLTKGVEVAQAIANGDLTQRLNIEQQDEIGYLCQAMDEMSKQMDQVIGQSAKSSQQIAAATSDQAATIEEISSSIEEMNAMTRQSADNAQLAHQLSEETKQVGGKAAASMQAVSQSMFEVSEASNQMANIIKTIDSIAFQTNLLALNAAVEAARAGEAGMGFAVVADEVRNLARRAAEAAKNTADLIEDTRKKILSSTDMTKNTTEIFTEMEGNVTKIASLVTEISTASQEQAKGIEQVNTAINEMAEVVQRNAAAAEEMANSMAIFTTHDPSATDAFPEDAPPLLAISKKD